MKKRCGFWPAAGEKISPGARLLAVLARALLLLVPPSTDCSRSSRSCPFLLPSFPSPCIPCLASLPSIPSVLADGQQERVRTLSPAASRCTLSRPAGLAGSKRVPHLERRQHRALRAQQRLASHPFNFICQLWLHSHFTFANLGFTFTSLCQPWLHSHFTLPTWLHFLFCFTLHGYVGKSPPRAGAGRRGLIAVSQRRAGKETFLRKAKARAKDNFLTRKAKAKASSRESDPSDDVWTDTSPLSPRTARTAVGAARRVFFWARGVMMALMPRGFGLRYTVKQPPGHSVVYSVDVLAWGGQIQMWTSIKPTAPRSQGCYFTA